MMSYRYFDDFVFLCHEAGFANVSEVIAYMRERGINCYELFDELNNSNVRINGVLATKKDLAELERRLRLGYERATAKYFGDIIYVETL